MEAYLYQSEKDGLRQTVTCRLCHHYCVIAPGKRGICRVRENKKGVLETLVYGRVIASAVDPVEKKPMFHFLPGTRTYSIATVGCNLKCRFCQNADIAQLPADRDDMIVGEETPPRAVVAAAKRDGCQSIAFTYTEPTVYFEFAHDTARLAASKGLKNIFVTNGYMSAEAVAMAAPHLHGANVDLKAFSNDFYKTYCGARLDPVKQTLKALVNHGVFVEVTTLVIPGLNDSPDELRDLAAFIANELGCDVPWHVSRFHPTYRLTDRAVTPVDTLLLARDLGLSAGLRYVYVGNVPGGEGENTYCHHCKALLVGRLGYTIRENRILNAACPDCKTPVAGVYQV